MFYMGHKVLSFEFYLFLYNTMIGIFDAILELLVKYIYLYTKERIETRLMKDDVFMPF